MKKIIAASWAGALSFFLLALLFILGDANAQLISRSLSLRDLADQLKTPEAVANYMWHNFSFEKDQSQFGKNEVWQAPLQFIETKKGDCEDFAWFAYEMLRINGKKSSILNIYGNGFGHSVCVFTENGRFNMIDGNKVVRLEAKDLKDVAYEIYPFWQSAVVVIPSEGSTPKVVKKIVR